MIELPTQPRVAAQLSRVLEANRVAHAYAFVGPKGSGRLDAAMRFAVALLCAERGCGTCRVCRMVEARQHPDLHLIVPTPPDSNPRGTKLIRIKSIRELERQASLKPVMGSWKIFVLADADFMTEDAPQAFLKTLEEPPDRTVIVLLLERARSMPPTILSRCQLVRFAPRPTGAPAEGATALALIGEARESGMPAVFARFDRSRPDRAEAEAIVDAWWLWCRDLMLAKAGAPAHVLTMPDRAADFAAEAELWSLREIERAIAMCREAREGLAVNVAPRLTLEMLLTRLGLRVA